MSQLYEIFRRLQHTILLRKVGMLTNDNRLHSLVCNNYDYYLAKGEPWFLEACLLQPYEIDNI